MLNKSAIFKAAHAKAKYDRETWPSLHEGISYRETFALCLRMAWAEARNEAKHGKPATTPEIEALEAEHRRRDLSSNMYFGSKTYRQTETQIKELKQAA